MAATNIASVEASTKGVDEGAVSEYGSLDGSEEDEEEGGGSTMLL